ncbi:V-type proton ATPase subunit d [Fusarium oxysporum f. sp. albedinis]|nr:V-type proton ATPase subunit d [Fusarium oxysporum f. sp. albedinis]
MPDDRSKKCPFDIWLCCLLKNVAVTAFVNPCPTLSRVCETDFRSAVSIEGIWISSFLHIVYLGNLHDIFVMRRSYGRGSECVIGQASKTGPRSSEPDPVNDQTKQFTFRGCDEMETEISGLPCGVELVLRLSCLGPTVEG